MQAYVACSTAAAWMTKLAYGLAACATALRSSARRLDAWILARDKAAADRDALLAMSARELRDIGIDASQVRAATTGDWVRDWGA